jgi:hypothetical protein
MSGDSGGGIRATAWWFGWAGLGAHAQQVSWPANKCETRARHACESACVCGRRRNGTKRLGQPPPPSARDIQGEATTNRCTAHCCSTDGAPTNGTHSGAADRDGRSCWRPASPCWRRCCRHRRRLEQAKYYLPASPQRALALLEANSTRHTAHSKKPASQPSAAQQIARK